MIDNHHFVIEAEEILRLLPHRPPFLLIDRVVDYKCGSFIRAVKNVSINEPYLAGHFPHNPLLPGVLAIEAMAQAMGILMAKTQQREGEMFYLVAIDDARFKRIIRAGDQMIIDVKIGTIKGSFIKAYAQVSVQGQIACHAQLMLSKREAYVRT